MSLPHLSDAPAPVPSPLDDAPALVAAHGRAWLLTGDGELLSLTAADAEDRLRGLPPPLLVHAPATWRRLGMRARPALDLLELFAFVRPAAAAAPTPRGLALALGLPPPETPEQAAGSLGDIAAALLRRLHDGRGLPLNRDAAGLAVSLARAGWGWGLAVAGALGAGAEEAGAGRGTEPLRVWKRLPKWEEVAPPPPPSGHPVAPAEARRRLAEMLGPGAENRPGQADYADAACGAFDPRGARGDPHLLLMEAGTGTGKTLGYVAPASLWAERNGGAVWISTFTRHLQRQIETELGRLPGDEASRRRRVVVRKGRENYLCLLNYATEVSAPLAGTLLPMALIARWATMTADGDIQGGDLPGWFAELFGAAFLRRLADRRGECIHGACEHYRSCFVEHTIRRARGAELVVANHALVMAQAVWGGLDEASVPTRYVFDEGHHLFDAADGAFSAVLSGMETAELRRWLLGAEGARTRARGVRARLADLVAGRPELEAPLDAALSAARALPAPGWSLRLSEAGGPGSAAPDGAEIGLPDLGGIEPGRVNPTEQVLRVLRRQVLARNPGGEEDGRGGDLACDLFPVDPMLPPAAAALARALSRIEQPLRLLATRLADRLETDAEELDAPTRSRIEGFGRSLRRRALDPLAAWQAMLTEAAAPAPDPGERPTHVHFLTVARRDAGDRDVGLHRHWLDPTVPFAAVLAAPAHGMLITSATLRDGGARDVEAAWRSAEARTGAAHLPSPAIRAAVPSPFDYAAQTRVMVVTDVAGGDIGALAGAYRALFEASGGGALGLFTAISRLRAVALRIAGPLEAAGLPLYAQHIDAMDNATLVDVFRTEIDSCLLGTDAMRDGVDVPGRALRLVVFERVPWPRPDILHRERRTHLSEGDPGGYDDRVARLRLRQAFGRLIRGGGDRGVFVLLDRRTPSRLLSAFPEGVRPVRMGLAEAVGVTREFFQRSIERQHFFF